MKNIHLIPTNKPSRLMLRHGKLFFFKDDDSVPKGTPKNQNIYITSDEEIKEGDWIFDIVTKRIEIAKFNHNDLKRDWKKIVMTNDLELIEDGIQQIGDNFFEWLVLNPYCKEVEIGKTNKLLDVYEDEWETKYHIYNIHEEPKKNFYCGDEVDYGEQCGFQCENCVDKNGVDYGYLPKEDLGYTTKIGIKVVDGMVRPLMVPKKYFGEVEHIHYSSVFDWLSKKDYLSDSREIIEKEFKEYLKK